MSEGQVDEGIEARVYTLLEFPALTQRIGDLRTNRLAQYRQELRDYNKKRGKRPEVTRPRESFGGGTENGFYYEVRHLGTKLWVKRPVEPTWENFMWHRYHGMTGTRDMGLLADGGKYNRPINATRVTEYVKAICAGQWTDNFVDPICVTADGEVINGQHRLAAFGKVTPDGEEDAFRFLVLFNVPRDQIHLADTSKRTTNDLAMIARKTAVA